MSKPKPQPASPRPTGGATASAYPTTAPAAPAAQATSSARTTPDLIFPVSGYLRPLVRLLADLAVPREDLLSRKRVLFEGVAALIGADLSTLIDGAEAVAEACRADAPENPGARLGALIGERVRAGADKLTMFFADETRDGVDGTCVRVVARVRGRRLAKPLGWVATGLMTGLVRVDLPRIVRALTST